MMDELLRKCLFKTHPVKRPVLGLRKTVNRLNLSSLEEAHRTHYTPENIVLVLTGNFSEADVETLTQDFCSVKRTQATSNQAQYIENNKLGKDVEKCKEGITQTYLSMGVKTIHAKHSDTPALDVIDTIMGAGASSRLFIELREKRALAYSIESGHEYGSDYGYFHIGCAVETKRLEETKKLIRKSF
jgi:zinc protease